MQPVKGHALPGNLQIQGNSVLACEITLLTENKIQTTAKYSGVAHVYVTTAAQTHYSLGPWLIEDNVGTKIGDLSTGASLIAVEPSALNRLSGLLQNSSDIVVEIVAENGLVATYQTKRLAFATASKMFLCQHVSGTVRPSPGEKFVTANVDVSGVTFRFKTNVLGCEGDELALALPETAERTLRRAIPRIEGQVPFQFFIEDCASRILNFSVLGACVEIKNLAAVAFGTEVTCRIEPQVGDGVEFRALVVGTHDEVIHLLFSGETHLKDRFYRLLNASLPLLEMNESPEQAWTCLESFGYLDLLEGGLLKLMRDDCVAAWHELTPDSRFLQPVAFRDGTALGSISAIERNPGHWVPHSLATKVDPTTIDVTEGLYLSWPLYVLNRSRPGKISTWYDADKPWHNRFYQTFIREHQQDLGLETFVRKWFWCPDLTQAIAKLDPILKTFPNLKLQPLEHLELHALERRFEIASDAHDDFGASHNRFEHFIFEQMDLGIYEGTEVIGSCRMILSKLEVNPFSVFNCAHIAIFEEDRRKDPDLLKASAALAIHRMMENGIERGAITLDYDVAEPEFDNCGLVFFCACRCLTTSNNLLPGLISNNTLSYADMFNRKKDEKA